MTWDGVCPTHGVVAEIDETPRDARACPRCGHRLTWQRARTEKDIAMGESMSWEEG